MVCNDGLQTPSVTNEQFTTELEKVSERATSLYHNFLVLGDLNFDMLFPGKSQTLRDVMNLFSLDNMVQCPTFESVHGASLNNKAVQKIDV